MKQTSDTRYPYKRISAEIPDGSEYIKAVHPGKRIILENRAARPGANLILLMQRDYPV